MSNKEKPIRIALFGAAPDTPNMGVSALFVSAVTGLSKYLGPAEFVVFDNGLGRRTSIFRTADGRDINLTLFGARGGRRYYRPENLAAMALASRLGRVGAILNEGIRLIDSCNAVLDVSGGDSFSDIYGRERFFNIYRPKAIALNRGKPLILLPQTYGPFKCSAIRELAATVVQRCRMAWARDPDSYVAMRKLLDARYDADRHRCGVDLAFGLQPTSAREALDDRLQSWIDQASPRTPLVGFNVSGLLYNSVDGGVGRFGLKEDYRKTVHSCIQSVLERSEARVVLISHVMDLPGHYESDQAACIDVASRFGTRYPGRLVVGPAQLDQSQVKWLISKLDWFCGTRMHSTIAALSSMIPAAAIAYSAKTAGVFSTCGQREHVLDPRTATSQDLADSLLLDYDSRTATAGALSASMPEVMCQLDAQLRSIAGRVADAATLEAGA